MKLLKALLLFWSSTSCAQPIGFDHLYPPPYPIVPNHPQPELPAYPPSQPIDYMRGGLPGYTRHNEFGTITPCSIPAGAYRIDIKNIARTERISVQKLVLYLHINDAGLIVMRLKLKPKQGRDEEYIVIPYWSSSDLSNICSGVNFNFFFRGVNVYDKTLTGNLSGHLSPHGTRSNYRLTVDGSLERYDAFYNSKVSVNLLSQQMEYIYSYLK